MPMMAAINTSKTKTLQSVLIFFSPFQIDEISQV
jgi:hypothetical protein